MYIQFVLGGALKVMDKRYLGIRRYGYHAH